MLEPISDPWDNLHFLTLQKGDAVVWISSNNTVRYIYKVVTRAENNVVLMLTDRQNLTNNRVIWGGQLGSTFTYSAVDIESKLVKIGRYIS